MLVAVTLTIVLKALKGQLHTNRKKSLELALYFKLIVPKNLKWKDRSEGELSRALSYESSDVNRASIPAIIIHE